MRVEREGEAAARLAGTLAAPSVQRHRLPTRQELSLLQPGDQKVSLACLCPQFHPFRHLDRSLAWDPTL